MRKDVERMEGCIYVPRDVKDCQQPPKAEKGKKGSFLRAWGGHGPAKSLNVGSQPPEPGDNNLLLF